MLLINNISVMKNALETFRTARGLTYRELTEACGGRSLNAVYRHCKGDKIAAESAVVYSRNLGIPLSELRPDLWPPEEGQPPVGPTMPHHQASTPEPHEIPR